jgi:hypothetical protein
MTSDAYQRTSKFGPEFNLKTDPDNTYFWRMNRRRLEAEAVWDGMHAVAGTLNLKMGGHPVTPPLAETELAPLRIKAEWVPLAHAEQGNRRGIYILARRNFTFPMFDKFDRPESSVSCPGREMTTVAPQALWTLNSRVAYGQAERFAARLVKEHGLNAGSWIDAAWRLALSRAPSPSERQEALDLMEQLKQTQKDLKQPAPAGLENLDAKQAAALVDLCLTLFNLNEFLYVD